MLMRRYLMLLLAPLVVASPVVAEVPRPATFGQCMACHTTQKGQKSALGPNLWGISARKAGTLAGFKYSAGMTKYGQSWNAATLAAFLGEPRKTVPGTSMAFMGMKDPAKAREMADYLVSLK